jgi:uncharacterized protein with gpF-like domain
MFDDLCVDVEKLVKKHERNTKQNYKAAYRKLRNKLQKIYADYENEDDSVKLTKDELRKLDSNTAKTMIKMYKDNEKAIENTLNNIMDESYKAVNTITSKYNIEAVARKIDASNIIKKQVAGHIWTDRIKKYGNDFVYDVHGIIHQGLDDGDTFTTMAKKLKERFGNDVGNTMRIARTEGARVLEDSKYQAFDDLANNDNVQVFKIWHTMGDEAVRETHEAMEGVRVRFDEPFILPSGASAMYPKDSGVASEDINCRCYVEYVTELVDSENNQKTNDDSDNITENSGINIQEEEQYKQEERSEAYNYIKREFKDAEYLEVQKLETALSDEEIIKKIGGGDETGGSCSSLAFAYVANKNGLDVTDYRGGQSRKTLSIPSNIGKILELPNIKGSIERVERETSGTKNILLNLDLGKEYYLAAGRHAAIVKRTEEGVFYLELQSRYADNNGWQNFINERYGTMIQTLRKRFGCTSSQKMFGIKVPHKIIKMEVDSFKNNYEFKDLMGYVNTNTDKQNKGELGHEK